MSILLEAREWFSFSEAVDYLTLNLCRNIFDRFECMDLIPLIEDGKLPVYLNLSNDFRFLKIGLHEYDPEIEPLQYLTKEQADLCYTGEVATGFFEIDVARTFYRRLKDSFSEGAQWEIHWEYRPNFQPVLFSPDAINLLLLPVCLGAIPIAESFNLYDLHKTLAFQTFNNDEIPALFFFNKYDLKRLIQEITNPAPPQANESNKTNVTACLEGSPLMQIANVIWETHYQNLMDSDLQPTKTYLIAWIKEQYPQLSTNQAESLYNVTRRDPPNL